MEALREKLLKETFGSEIYLNEPMSLHTSFKTGGPADLFIDAAANDLPIILSILDGVVNVAIIGNGSNLLVGDGGIRGAVVCLGKNASDITIDEYEITADAGALLSTVSKESAKASLTGLEFASGIPGSVGGGVFMNAGAYDGQLGDYVSEVMAVAKSGKKEILFAGEDCGFGYRNSRFQNEDYIISKIKLKLTKGNPEEISQKIEDFTRRRKEKQPIEYPSAGSTFKRPEGFFAGKLIEDAGLKGVCVGGACVSEKHAGFIINKDRASSKDIKELIDIVAKKVFENSGIRLDTEIRFMGEF